MFLTLPRDFSEGQKLGESRKDLPADVTVRFFSNFVPEM
jgi:hypothetical protein